MHYRLSTLAEKDIADILSYSIETFGSTHAKRYLADIGTTFELLTSHPRLGRMMEAVSGNLRKFNCKNHAIIYTVRRDEIFIVRLYHLRKLPSYYC